MNSKKVCSVSGCTRTSETQGIKLFSYPKTKATLEQWIRFTQKSVIYDLDNLYICSAHFAAEDFLDNSRKLLKPTAVPSLVDQATLDIVFANENLYPTMEDDTNVYQEVEEEEEGQTDLNNMEVKYIKEEEVEYVKEEEIEYSGEPYIEVEIQEASTLDSDDNIGHENSESNLYPNNNVEILEINPEELINENTVVEINEAGSGNENSMKFVENTSEKDVSGADIAPVTVTYHLCRLCTKQVESDYFDIFGEDEISEQIVEMLNIVWPEKIKPDDGLPNITCINCVEKLKVCYETMLMFLESDAYFRNKEFISLPQPAGKSKRFDNCAIEDSLNEHHSGAENTDLNRAIIIENSEDLEKVIILNEMGKLESSEMNKTNSENGVVKKDKNHVCKFCAEKFDSLTNLVLHNYKKHQGANKERYSCPKCPLVFSMLQALKLHIQRKHQNKNKLYVCEECNFGFKHKHLLENHKRNNHKKHECEICGKLFLHAISLERHMEKHVDFNGRSNIRPHVCWICGKTYRMRDNLNNHIQIHFGSHSQAYPCLVCGRKLSSVIDLRAHIIESHKDRERIYKCTKCRKYFTTKDLLTRHLLTHCAEQLYICEVCGKGFKKSTTLERHRRNHPDIDDTQRDEQSESASHVDLDVYECETCGKKIVSKLSFKYHMSKHTGEKKPFDCEDCGMTFAKVQGYRTHILIHRGEFPFVCDKCGKGFRTKRTLQQHEVVHTDERPYSCSHCDLAFKRMDSLYMHQAVHSGKRPFNCTVCGKSFTRKQDTRTHLIRYHKMHNSAVDGYILKREDEENGKEDLEYSEDGYFTEYICIENSLEVETS